jgi:hypothetical protein
MPVIPAIWELETERIERKKVSETPPPFQQPSQMWWSKPVFPATQEA